jgi:hypothetical protein
VTAELVHIHLFFSTRDLTIFLLLFSFEHSGINDILVYIQVFESTASTSLMKEATHDNSMQPASTR